MRRHHTYHVHIVAACDKWFKSCGTGGKFTLWTALVLLWRPVFVGQEDGLILMFECVVLDDSLEVDEPAAIIENQQSHPTGIVLHRVGYYTMPPLDELTCLMNEDGSCIVDNFTVGREGYGNVFFPDPLNVANLNLDEIGKYFLSLCSFEKTLGLSTVNSRFNGPLFNGLRI